MRALVPPIGALAVLAAALALTVTRGGTLGAHDALYGWYALDLAAFTAAVVLLRRAADRLADRQVAALVLLGSVVLALVGLLAPPRTSDDAYRYVWDGRVQAAAESPYRFAPDDPALARLRAASPDLFPVQVACAAWDERRLPDGGCSHVNRPSVHTIYPPVAEFWFLLLRGGVRSAQLAGAVLSLAVTGLLLARRPQWRAAVWGWFPGTVLWAVNDAHVDVLGVLFGVGGLLLARRGRPAAGGAAVGAAVAVKLYPVLLLLGLVAGRTRRRPIPLLAAAAVVALSYLPYVVASGTGVLGYLPGYLHEEGYAQGDVQRFGLLRLVLPGGFAPVAAVLVLAAVAVRVLRHGDPARPWRGPLLLTGAALLVTSPGYPWYGLLLVALAALDGRVEWLAVPAAGAVCYLAGGAAQQPAYGVALAVVLTGSWLRRARKLRPSADHRSTWRRPAAAARSRVAVAPSRAQEKTGP